MELIIGVIFIAVVAYLVFGRKKTEETIQHVVEEVKAEAVKLEQKAEVVVAKVEEEVKVVAKKAKTAASKAKTKAVEVEQEVVAEVKAVAKKVAKPRTPKAKPPVL
jgi:FtsZ-interacting cell division protein ZipA